jgi:para-aminobenzoate synthetase component 1
MNNKLTRYTREETINQINHFGSAGTPFVFLISFDGERNCIMPLLEAAEKGFFMQMPGMVNHSLTGNASEPISFKKSPIDKERYRKAFLRVTDQILYGNSFLLNLTFPTGIESNYSLGEIFRGSIAPYKLFLEDELVVFSPERFVRIEGRTITSNPMKGTIDASIPGAHSKLTSDRKEDAEHNTIVDLIRNDLSSIAKDVRVKRFKYIDRVRTHQGELLQMSSEVMGTLPDGFERSLGDLIFKLLPAGSICGAPKKKTVEIILDTEQYDRGYYTGVFGYWNGKSLESAVAIRYIEKQGDGLVFKSGGGITFQSHWKNEYEEMLNKVYVPIY